MVQLYSGEDFSVTQMLVAGGIGAGVGAVVQKGKNSDAAVFLECGCGDAARHDNGRGYGFMGAAASGFADFSGKITGFW